MATKALDDVDEIEGWMEQTSPHNVQGFVIARQNLQIKYLKAKEMIQRLRTEIKILKGTIGAKRRAAREKAAVAGAKATGYVVPEDIRKKAKGTPKLEETWSFDDDFDADADSIASCSS